MVNLGVIAKQDEPTDWVSSMVVVRKPGKLRICLDPKDLNRAIKREHYHLQTIDEIIERLPKACVFSRFDATHGFWHIQLDNDSSKFICRTRQSCCSSFSPHTRISSTIHSTPGRSENISRTVLQNTSGAELIPNGSLQYRYRPNGVLNVNNLELSLSSWMCQNP
jgi:hypothetical protein